jgi:hypothetical protein
LGARSWSRLPTSGRSAPRSRHPSRDGERTFAPRRLRAHRPLAQSGQARFAARHRRERYGQGARCTNVPRLWAASEGAIRGRQLRDDSEGARRAPPLRLAPRRLLRRSRRARARSKRRGGNAFFGRNRRAANRRAGQIGRPIGGSAMHSSGRSTGDGSSASRPEDRATPTGLCAPRSVCGAVLELCLAAMGTGERALRGIGAAGIGAGGMIAAHRAAPSRSSAASGRGRCSTSSHPLFPS